MELCLHTTRTFLPLLLLAIVAVSPTLGMDPSIDTFISPTVRTPIALWESAPTAGHVPDPESFSAGVDGGNRDRIVRAGMTVLGGWAVANIVSGLAGMASTVEPANAASNAIADGMDITSYREESHSLEKVLLFNAGVNHW